MKTKEIIGGLGLAYIIMTLFVICITKPNYKVTYPDGRIKYSETADSVRYGGCNYIMLDDSSLVSSNFDIVEL